ncbi:MAG TPA: phosphate acyltransferase PlsX [Candidatus Kapabacteria bacterium]|nr:phosphate acyltransferase PlsX [Candidatus Kapabacteria bacterium]
MSASASSDNSQSARKVRIVLDAMGGDFSPKNEVLGALETLQLTNQRFHIILIGREAEIRKALAEATAFGELTRSSSLEIVNADEIIGMEDEPVMALRQKRNSSIVKGFDLVKSGEADAFVSAGNTGAVMSGGTLLLGRIPGVSRPTIGSQFPREDGSYTLLFDVGATVDSKAIHLKEYAIMGSIYAEKMFGVKNPRVGLLSVGEERSKGNELVFESIELLEKAKINFIGNVEGRDVKRDTADVIVCDGFVGNVILKFAESVLTALKARLKAHAEKGLMQKLMSGVTAKVLKVVLKDYDYQEYGGVPLLGVKGVAIIGHGRSTPKALRNMILKAEEMVIKDVNGHIQRALAEQSAAEQGANESK